MKKLIWKNVWQALAAIVFLVAVWFVAYFWAGNELLVPSFSDSLQEIGELFVSGNFWQGFGMTLLRSVNAFALSLAAAVVFAVVAYLYPSLGVFLAPIVSALRSLPVMAILLPKLCRNTHNLFRRHKTARNHNVNGKHKKDSQNYT